MDSRHRILEAALPFVHVHGWTRKALAAGAEAEGYPAVTHGMFPRGGAELISFFYSTSNKRLGTILAEKVQSLEEEEKPSTREFIGYALEARLRMILPYIDTWPQAMAIQTLPQNAVESWTNLANLVDEVWYYAGDRSVDFNWYTKRAALAGVYKATEIYMLQDRSEDNTDTWAFLHRRLDDMKTLGNAVRQTSQTCSVVGESLWGLCIVGRNILGMNPRHR